MRRFLALSSATALLFASSVGLSAPAFATAAPSECVTDCTVATPFVLPSKPGAPTGLVAKPDPASGGAILSWTDPVETGGSEIIQYILQRSEDGTNWDDVARNSTFTSPFLDDNLIQGTSYQWQVAAVNDDGTGPFSAIASMLSQRYPGFVKNFTGTPGDHSATLTWEYPQDDGGTPITGYEVQYAATEDSWSVPDEDWIPVTTTTALTHTFTGLDNETWYGFRIRPINAQGPSSGGWDRAQVYPRAPYIPGNPTFNPIFTAPDGSPLNFNTMTPGTAINLSLSNLPFGAKLTAYLQRSDAAVGPNRQSRMAAPLAMQAPVTPPGATELGSATAGVDGTVRLSTSIPSELPLGDYTLIIALTDAGEDYLPYNVDFAVKAASSGNAGSGSGSGSQPGSGVTAAPVAAAVVVPAAADSLANTGATTSWMVSIGALLLMAGFASTLVARRRRV